VTGIEDRLADRTEPGYCHLCGIWTREGLIIAEIPGSSGTGGTVVRCRACVSSPRQPQQRDVAKPRYSG